jgi:hypothetical protein
MPASTMASFSLSYLMQYRRRGSLFHIRQQLSNTNPPTMAAGMLAATQLCTVAKKASLLIDVSVRRAAMARARRSLGMILIGGQVCIGAAL